MVGCGPPGDGLDALTPALCNRYHSRRMPVDDAALREAIRTVEAAVDDPHRWLPQPIFYLVSRLMPLANVDLLVQDERGRTLLTWRDDEFFGQGWHVPGSTIRFQETIADRVHGCAQMELGAEVAFDPFPIAIEEEIDPALTTRGHCLALLYRCRLLSPPEPAREWTSGPPQRDQWAWHAGPPANLLPVHQRYVRFLE